MSDHEKPPHHPVTLASSAVVLTVLCWAVIVGVSPNASARLVQVGEAFWPGYASTLREDVPKPDCDLAALEQQASTCTDAPAPAPDGGNPFEDAPAPAPEANPFEDDAPAPAPAPAPEPNPFEDDAPAPAPAPAGGDNPFEDAPAPAGGDPFADDAPAAAPQVNCAAVKALKDRCQVRFDEYEQASGRLTSSVKTFRSFETRLSGLANFPYWKELLAVVVLLGAMATTIQRMHIALREPRQLLEHRVSQAAQLVSHLVFVATMIADWRVAEASTAEVANGALPFVWGIGFAVLALVNVVHLAQPPKFADLPTTPGRLAMVIPLPAYLILISAVWFFGFEAHPSGIAIYMHKFAQIPSIYIGVALYVWAGMLLSETRIAPTIFDVIMPWKLPAAILTFLVIVGGAYPTAYSGASGIFVLAAGSVVFTRLMAANVDRRLAFAATAMCGSLGVVLNPCLIIVVIALLNKQVTTTDLYGWGFYVFLLTAALTLVAMVVRSGGSMTMASPREAMPESLGALKRLIPYTIGAVVVLVFYWGALGTKVSEHTASVVLPVVFLVLLLLEKATDPPGQREVWIPLRRATAESAAQVGALLMLMATSTAFGGVVERSEVMDLVPPTFGSPILAMCFLVCIKVVLGMLMDGLGGVVLVSVSLAPIAYRNGIDPIHFWMMVLCGFELGYLTPPAGINQLLARQVVGPEARMEDFPVEGGFYRQYEHLLLPVGIMLTTLLIVAFVPFAFYD